MIRDLRGGFELVGWVLCVVGRGGDWEFIKSEGDVWEMEIFLRSRDQARDGSFGEWGRGKLMMTVLLARRVRRCRKPYSTEGRFKDDIQQRIKETRSVRFDQLTIIKVPFPSTHQKQHPDSEQNQEKTRMKNSGSELISQSPVPCMNLEGREREKRRLGISLPYSSSGLRQRSKCRCFLCIGAFTNAFFRRVAQIQIVSLLPRCRKCVTLPNLRPINARRHKYPIHLAPTTTFPQPSIQPT